MKLYTAPEPLPKTNLQTGLVRHSVFLAGSIEMGSAAHWQYRITEELKDFKKAIVFNPRRADWDSSWKQDINNPQFNQQVTWELAALDSSEYIFMYFDPNTKSPISLLELGLHCRSKATMIVCCPQGFWRKGNVDIVCKIYGCFLFDNLDNAVMMLKRRFESKKKQSEEVIL